MKSAIIILALVALSSAVPKPTKLHYRNLFKPAIHDVVIKPGPRIIGGHEAEPHSIPYQVFLEVFSDFEGWYCGGSLISENYVLTAGHCGVDAAEAAVTLGAHMPLQPEDTQQHINSKEVTVHADYDGNLIINDIAVIKLPTPASITDAVQTVPLPSSNDANNDYAGSTARISGWGLTDGFGDTISDVLNYVDVEVITNEECEQDFGTLEPSIVCTSGKDSTGSCNGDSGGPLTVDGVQIGIVSFGMRFCPTGYPSAFSRVTSFLSWIESNTDVQIQ